MPGLHTARRFSLRRALMIAVVGSALGATPALADGGGWDHGGWGSSPPAVYSMTNDPAANTIVVFGRHPDGTLTQLEEVFTGGRGAANQPPFGFPVVDSSQSMRLSPDGRLLFAVNSGDNSVSSFRVTPWGLTLVDHVSSGGTFPISLDDHGNLLYVLNEGNSTVPANISGLWISPDGTLTPIANSSQPLSSDGGTAPFSGAPAQIGFSPDGSVLNVTERLTNTIDTFRMQPNGTPGPAVPTTTPAGANNPFGFAYQGFTHLIVTNADAADTPMFSHSSASSYQLGQSPTKPLTPISPLVYSHGAATCWVVLTPDQHWAFMTNTGSGGTPNAISTFSVAPDGALTWVRNTAATAGFTSDLDLSHDGRYLYVLLPSNVVNPFTSSQAPAGPTSHIDEYSVGPNGTLTPIGSTPSDLPDSLSGLAAW